MFATTSFKTLQNSNNTTFGFGNPFAGTLQQTHQKNKNKQSQHQIMVASAVFITDLSGKSIISRNYRGDVPLNVAIDHFAKYLTDTPDEQKKPIFFYSKSSNEFVTEEDVEGCRDGETFVYINVRVVVVFARRGYCCCCLVSLVFF